MDKVRCAASEIVSALLVITSAGCAASRAEQPHTTATTPFTGAAAPSLTATPFAVTSEAVSTPVARPNNTQGLIDVGGYRLYIECSGQGRPTVVLDAGFSGFSGAWKRVIPEVATFTTVCAYDRANRGASDSARSRPQQSDW